MFVPVVDQDSQPLMPTKPSRARRWIKEGKATPFWKRGVFCVRLNQAPSAREFQPIAVGIDPGSKKEGFTVKSQVHTYLNIQADAVTWVRDAVEVRRNMRRARRFRKTPCRKNKCNRARCLFPPSIKARWQWKLRLCQWLAKLFPIECFVIEDIKARTQSGKRWNTSGHETSTLRGGLELAKIKRKTAEVFEAHCVDSWVLANWWVGGHTQPDSKQLLCITPLRFHRRQLHRLQCATGGIRKPYGSTLSHGLKCGSLVKHPKWGLAYVGGFLKDRISLHTVASGKRLCQNANPADCRFLTFNIWRARALPLPPKVGSLRA